MMNEKYVAAGNKGKFPYKTYSAEEGGITVHGLPEGISVRHIASLGKEGLQRIHQEQDKITVKAHLQTAQPLGHPRPQVQPSRRPPVRAVDQLLRPQLLNPTHHPLVQAAHLQEELQHHLLVQKTSSWRFRTAMQQTMEEEENRNARERGRETGGENKEGENCKGEGRHLPPGGSTVGQKSEQQPDRVPGALGRSKVDEEEQPRARQVAVAETPDGVNCVDGEDGVDGDDGGGRRRAVDGGRDDYTILTPPDLWMKHTDTYPTFFQNVSEDVFPSKMAWILNASSDDGGDDCCPLEPFDQTANKAKEPREADEIVIWFSKKYFKHENQCRGEALESWQKIHDWPENRRCRRGWYDPSTVRRHIEQRGWYIPPSDSDDGESTHSPKRPRLESSEEDSDSSGRQYSMEITFGGTYGHDNRASVTEWEVHEESPTQVLEEVTELEGWEDGEGGEDEDEEGGCQDGQTTVFEADDYSILTPPDLWMKRSDTCPTLFQNVSEDSRRNGRIPWA
ncbi:hypothetical protein Bbelb_193290 [Branchiostoma belcheri]|nr:hypothetical protein Bbelb_193290 [Branchiostoma belcheri]